jgi:hypothetical protein
LQLVARKHSKSWASSNRRRLRVSEIEGLHGIIMVRLRTHRAARPNPEGVAEALELYVRAVQSLAGIE